MGRHFSDGELDTIQNLKAQRVPPTEIHKRLLRVRRRRGERGPDLTSVRRALKGVTLKRARVETRGGRSILSPRNLRALDAARKRLLKKAQGEYEVHWDDIIREARVPKVDRTTAAKSMRKAGYDVKCRAPRLKPDRSAADDAQRKEICDKLRKLPRTFWTTNLDVCIDCKRWQIPRSVRACARCAWAPPAASAEFKFKEKARTCLWGGSGGSQEASGRLLGGLLVALGDLRSSPYICLQNPGFI